MNWEYLVKTRDAVEFECSENTIEAGLNKLGYERWELIAVDGDLYIFKRMNP